jgi:hypothetical protein
MPATIAVPDRPELRELLDRLSGKATEDYYNPYQTFDWPDSIPEDRLWMSPDLLSVYGTEYMDSLPFEKLVALSRWESINFYSLNVHGIRELLIEVTRRVHSPDFEVPSEFFHHFIGEENEHMWFFATFCLNYGGKLYVDRKIQFEDAHHPAVQNFLVFARILIFEQIVDYFNLKMANDEQLHPTIRQVNAVHHQDESRHIAFGNRLVDLLWKELPAAGVDEEELAGIRDYLRRYLRMNIELLYNPSCYVDAGIENAFQVRQAVMAHPARAEVHRNILQRTESFLKRIGVLN